jgi:hypothetical protein
MELIQYDAWMGGQIVDTFGAADKAQAKRLAIQRISQTKEGVFASVVVCRKDASESEKENAWAESLNDADLRDDHPPEGRMSSVTVGAPVESAVNADLVADYSMTFRTTDGSELITFGKEAVIYRGRLLTDEKEIVDGMRAFLRNTMKPTPRDGVISRVVFSVATRHVISKIAGLIAKETVEAIQRLGFRSEPEIRDSGMLVATMYSGLVPVEAFDAVEIHDMTVSLEDGGFVPLNLPTDRACAFSVQAHYVRGGVDTVADFRFDPDDAHSKAVATMAANELANSLGSMIMAASPDLKRGFVLRGVPDLPVSGSRGG